MIYVIIIMCVAFVMICVMSFHSVGYVYVYCSDSCNYLPACAVFLCVCYHVLCSVDVSCNSVI